MHLHRSTLCLLVTTVSRTGFVQALEDEDELLQCMRAKLGPFASETAIKYHLRSARGKVFWAGIGTSGLSYSDIEII